MGAQAHRNTASHVPAALISAAILASAREAQCDVEITGSESRAWNSATFTGSIIRLSVRGVVGDASDRWLAALADVELAPGKHLLADLSIPTTSTAGGRFSATVDALTVEA